MRKKYYHQKKGARNDRQNRNNLLRICHASTGDRNRYHYLRLDRTMVQLEKFKHYLNERGAVLQDPTNEWELVRFKTTSGVSIIYTNKRGDLTFTGESEKAYRMFKEGKKWKAINRQRQSLRQKKAKLATRDGKRCFAHGEKMNFDALTIEHMLNFSHGGSDNENNLALVCEPCNKELGNQSITKKMETIWRLRRAYLHKIQGVNSGI